MIAVADLSNSTGLMSNFYNILIVDVIRNKFYSYRRELYLKTLKCFTLMKTIVFDFYRIDFSEDFLLDKDWNNVSFKVEKYRIFKGKESKALLIKKNIDCKL